jgi:hypothetical protein
VDTNLALEADTAISQLPTNKQAFMRQLVANNIEKIINKHNTSNEKRSTIQSKREYLEWNTIKSVKQKIIQNQLTITKAKGIH